MTVACKLFGIWQYTTCISCAHRFLVVAFTGRTPYVSQQFLHRHLVEHPVEALWHPHLVLLCGNGIHDFSVVFELFTPHLHEVVAFGRGCTSSPHATNLNGIAAS